MSKFLSCECNIVRTLIVAVLAGPVLWAVVIYTWYRIDMY